MTPRQRDCLNFIAGYWREFGYSPSFDEIAQGLGLSGKGRVAVLVAALCDREYLTKRRARARSVELTEKGWNICPG